jgi:hypothetical protein
MTFKESASIYLRHRGVSGLLLWLLPVRRIKGQWFVMRPHWYNGNFSWRSVNRARF